MNKHMGLISFESFILRCTLSRKVWYIKVNFKPVNRVRVRLYWKVAHSVQSPTLSTNQPYILIFSPTLTQILKWVDKNRAFSKFKVNFWGEIVTESLWKWFSLKNTKLEEQLSLRSFFIQLRADAYVRLLNKPYENEVTLKEQNRS